MVYATYKNGKIGDGLFHYCFTNITGKINVNITLW